MPAEPNYPNLSSWRRLLRVPWTARRSNQSILMEISPGCSLEGMMLKWNSNTLATWCEELTHWKRPWCWERLRARREGDDRGWDGWMASPTRWLWVWVMSNGQWVWVMDMSLGKLQELVMDRKAWCLQSMGSQSWTRLSNCTELKYVAESKGFVFTQTGRKLFLVCSCTYICLW